MDHATAGGRRLASGGLPVMLFAGGLALLAIFTYAPDGAPPPAPVAELASIGLVDDDADGALFTETGLTPGHPVSRCIEVSYAGSTPAGTVYLAARDLTGNLPEHLDVTVEQGTGGDYDSCVGFAGSVIYAGTLAGLVDPDANEPRTATGWSPGASDARTFRVTATLRDVAAAQNGTGTATFIWLLVGGPEPTKTATSSPTPEPTASPTPSPNQTEPVSPTSGPAAPVASAGPAAGTPGGTEPTRIPRLTVDSGTSDEGEAAPRGAFARLKEAVAELARDIAAIAASTSRHSALPISAFGVLVAFLAVQSRIDRRDPKLALAPMNDPHLVFEAPESDILRNLAPSVVTR